MTTRRAFQSATAALCAWSMLAPFRVHAQPPARMVRVAVVFNSVPRNDLEDSRLVNRYASAFRSEMSKLGWVQGVSLKIAWLTAQGDPSRVPTLLDECLAGPVDVLVLAGDRMIAEGSRKTRTVPIVMATSVSPVQEGLVLELGRPGGNITGLTWNASPEIYGKRLALLREIVPRLARVAVMTGPMLEDSAFRDFEAAIRPAAQRLGVSLMRYQLMRGQDAGGAFADAARKKVDGALFEGSVDFDNPSWAVPIHASAKKHRMPVMHSQLSGVGSGGLIAYASDAEVNYRRAAHYVDRILRGANAGDLAIEQPASYALHVNSRAAREIGLKLSPSLLTQADKIVD